MFRVFDIAHKIKGELLWYRANGLGQNVLRSYQFTFNSRNNKRKKQNIGIRIDILLSYTPFIPTDYDKTDTILNPYNKDSQKDTQQIQTHTHT